MRVLHLVTNTRGGAGIAATRLHLALLEQGQDSVLLSRNTSGLPNSQICETSLIRKILSKFITLLLKMVTVSPYSLVTPFSLKTLDYQQIKRINPDVIHIHNWYNLINLKMISKLKKNYRVVLTLHDSRIYTGGCHYAHACRGYVTNCAKCPAIRVGKFSVQKSKTESSQISNLKIALIFPSEWLRSSYIEAYPLNNCYIDVVPNVISAPSAKPVKIFSKIKSWNVTFISARLANPTKGLSVLFKSLQQSELNSPENRLILVGERGHGDVPPDTLLMQLEYTGSIGEGAISSILSKTHILATPSLSDNLPSVIGEGQSHGCIVLGTRVGGIPELVEDGKNGFLCEPTFQDMSATINRIFHSEQLQEISKKAVESFNSKFKSDSILIKHIEIYNARV